MTQMIDGQVLKAKLEKLSEGQMKLARRHEGFAGLHDVFVARAIGVDYAIRELLRMMQE